MTKRVCPICERPLPRGEKKGTFPFCSSRCQLVDLGRWLDGDYRIAGEEADVAEAGVPSEPSSEG